MEVEVSIQSKDLTKEELRLLIQAIRDCEQKWFPDKEIFIWIDARELTSREASEILDSVKPTYKYGPIHMPHSSKGAIF